MFLPVLQEGTGLRCILVSVDARPNNAFFDSEPGGRGAAPGPLALVQAFANTVAEEGARRWEAFADPESFRCWLVQRGLLSDGEVLAANREAEGLEKPSRGRKEKREMPFEASFRHEYWTSDVRYIKHAIPEIGQAPDALQQALFPYLEAP